MAVNAVVVRALKESYTVVQLQAARAQAAADVLSGVQVTQVSFEGGGATGRPISGDPSWVLEHIQAALDLHEDAAALSKPSSAFVDLSQRPWGT